MGCFCQFREQEIKELINADIILGNKDKSKVLDYINEFENTKNTFYQWDEVFQSCSFYEQMIIKHPSYAYEKMNSGEVINRITKIKKYNFDILYCDI